MTPFRPLDWSEEQLPRQILAASRDLIFVLDRESRFVWANRALLNFAGRRLEELQGTLSVPRSPDRSRHFLEDDARVFETGREVDRDEEAVIGADGATRWLHTVKSPIRDARGRVVLLLAVARDVTEARAARVALDRINKCLLRFGSDSLDNIARLTALCGELLGADMAAYNRLDKGVLSAVGQWNVPPDFNPVSAVESSLCGKVIAGETGDPLVVHDLPEPAGGTYIGQAVRGGDRALGSLCAVFRRRTQLDKTVTQVLGIVAAAIAVEESRLAAVKAQARLAEDLRQAHKMEAVGRLAGGIAHDFNNTLTTIKGYSEMIAHAAPDAGTREDAGQILKSVDFAASLTRQLLAFGRRQMLVPRVTDLRDAARASAGMLDRLIGDHIRLSCELPDEPVPVFADPGQIAQALINLAINARDAMPDGGALTLRVREAAAAEVPPDEAGRPAAGRYAVVSVCDTGSGISPEILPRIFEPFFTTKEQGKGTGLGLATVYGVVAQSGGRVTCDSVPGKGSVFTVWLPRCDAPLAPAPEPGKLADLRGSGTVLLVEDDAAIRAMFARALTAAGYTVLSAPDAEAALALAARPEGAFDALVTDVMMPGLNGRQLAMRLEKDRPNLKVLYMSGYTDDAAFRSALRPGTAFLQKPFNPSDLCRRLKELLP